MENYQMKGVGSGILSAVFMILICFSLSQLSLGSVNESYIIFLKITLFFSVLMAGKSFVIFLNETSN